MTAKVIPLRPAKPVPAVQELVVRVRELAKDSNNMFLSLHATRQMRVRGKSMRDILETCKKGGCVKGPDLDEFGDWRIKLRRCVCGKRTQVVVAVRERDFSVVTVF